MTWTCDGCRAPINECFCEEIEAERARDYGPICHACGGGQDDGYEQCEFAASGVYEPGPGSESSHGCPRVTGSF